MDENSPEEEKTTNMGENMPEEEISVTPEQSERRTKNAKHFLVRSSEISFWRRILHSKIRV